MTYLEEYATAVLDGKIVACRRIKQVYERLLNDLYNQGEYHFDEEEANAHIDFIEKFCKQSQGDIGAPLKLELFQKAKFQAVFGFVDDDNVRKYNEVLTIEGRKNGKTTEMAGVSLDLLVNDNEGAPEVYFIATKRDQAKKGFDEANRMLRHSPELQQILRKRQTDIYCRYNEGTAMALASNSNSLDGLNGHGVIIDELSAIKNRDLYDLMKQSMSARRQPLLFCITTNGFVRDNIFDSQYEYACGILDGRIDNPHFLPFIYELDDRDEWLNPKMWIKANPGLGTIKKKSFLTECVKKAKDDEAFRPTVMVKDFNLKENSASAWLRWEDVDITESFWKLTKDEDLQGREKDGQCSIIPFSYGIGGFDSADTTDLNSAKVLCTRPDDNNIYVKSMYWIPETTLEQVGKTGSRRERDNAPYDLWVKQGLMRTCEGAKCDKQIFLDWFVELREQGLYVLYIGYDPWHIDDSLLDRFKGEFGQNSMIPVRQGAVSLSEPMKELKGELTEHRIIYNDNPIDKWCLMNTEIKADVNGNIQPIKAIDKRKRIDGTVSLLCGYKVLLDHRDEITNLNEGI